jgi:hypothetical protein
VSPFLPHATVIAAVLRLLGLPVADDPVVNEVAAARSLGYEPMFMTDFEALLFPWKEDAERSDAETVVSVIQTGSETWVRRSSRKQGVWGDEDAFPVQAAADHEKLQAVCAAVPGRAAEITHYFREWRNRVGEDGVIVMGHPHVSWLGCQVGPGRMFLQWSDDPGRYRASMEAVYDASLVIMEIALGEGIDFMSDSTYGLEMGSPSLLSDMDLPFLRRFSRWTHDRGGLFWYHNCGHTRKLIRSGFFDRIGADVIETIAPPPCGDNDLAESRRRLSRSVCSKGNLDLAVLRDGTPSEVGDAAAEMVRAVDGFPHIFSTADAVLEGTPPENFIAFVQAARKQL